jgi:hypothetical protein
MKKKILFRIALLTLIASATIPGINSNINAQALMYAQNGDLYETPKGPFVSPEIAVDRLQEELTGLKHQMGLHPHSSIEYKIANWKYVYFEYIIKILTLDDAQTSEDIGEAMVRALTIYASDMYGDIPKEQKHENKTAAITLLKP